MIPFLLGALLLVSVARAEGIAFIVSVANPVNTLSRKQLADYFLKRVKTWSNGSSVRFIDRSEGSDERQEFLRNIVRKTPRDIELYWIGQKLYTGHSAPSQVSTDSMTEMMVSRFPGAIGYVSKDYMVTRPVKKITVTDE